jgi:uncharacterized protein (DUF111 family)
VTVAELIAVSAALAALRVVRVYAAALAGSGQQGAGSDSDSALSTLLLEEAEWPVVANSAANIGVTPSGAAILAALGEPDVPPLRLSAVGYGMGEDAPHILRCWLGTPYNAGGGPVPSGTRAAAIHRHPHDAGGNH